MKIGKREIVEKSLKLFSGVAKVSKRQLPLVLLLMHLCHPLNIFLHSGISCVKQLMTVCHELKQDFFDPSFEMINGLVPLRYQMTRHHLLVAAKVGVLSRQVLLPVFVTITKTSKKCKSEASPHIGRYNASLYQNNELYSAQNDDSFFQIIIILYCTYQLFIIDSEMKITKFLLKLSQ